MDTRKVAAFGLVLLVGQFGFADASYQTTTQITGGALVDQLKATPFAGRFTKDMFAPATTMTMVHGNQKAVVTKESIEIIDLDKETMTHVDLVKKTYSVVTFAQMRQALANMPKQMEQAQAQVKQGQQQMPKTDLKTSFDVQVKNTGVTKDVNGLSAQEQLITMSMKVTDPNAAPDTANAVTYTVTTDVWIAPDPPEIKEIQDFDKRMGQKMAEGVDLQAFATLMRANSNAGMAGLFGSQPGAADAMAQMGKEMAKLKGTHVMEVTSMGGNAAGAAAPTAAPTSAVAAPPATPSGGLIAGQVATDTATQTAAAESGKLGGLGSALSSSALGAFRKKKAASAPPPAAPAPALATAGVPATAQTAQNATLMSMTMQETNFSQDAISPSAFQVPAGFSQVQSPYDRIGR